MNGVMNVIDFFRHEIPTVYAFDLDGTVTEVEVLPLLAEELGIRAEMEALTAKAVSGQVSFQESFRQRVDMLKTIPVARIQEIVAKVPLSRPIADFIKKNHKICALVTGNIDLWIEPIVKELGCRVYSSRAKINEQGELELLSIVDKAAAIRHLKEHICDDVIAIGDSANDIPMFNEVNRTVLYTGVNKPSKEVSDAACFQTGDPEELIRILNSIDCLI